MKLKKPVIRGWDCADHDPIDEWIPDDPARVNYWCNVAIGVEGEDGADDFQVRVVTEQLLSQVEDRSFLIVLPYYEGWAQVLDAINERLDDIQELNWAGMQEPLAKLFFHEYGRYDR